MTVRNDTGVQEGGEISIYYDPMIAKLVTHAPSRAAAIEAQSTALDSFYIDGIRHNIPFLVRADEPSAMARGQAFHRLHRRGISARIYPRAPEGEVARRLAAVAAAIDHVLGERKRQISGQLIGRPVHARAPPRGVARSRGNPARGCARGRRASRFVLSAPRRDGRSASSASSWKPGDPVWQGTIDGHLSRCRYDRFPTASGLPIRASRSPFMSSPKRRQRRHG